MSWVLAFAGFAALIILHEFGHFTAAKAVGMRVERFSLFFGPMLAKVRRGETEYGVGVLPLGGYVKITGMNPNEELPREVAPRAYYRQPVWKRIVVISAGPAVNVLVAFLILWGLYLVNGQVKTDRDGQDVVASVVDKRGLEPPASRYLQAGDRIVAVDGVRGGQERLRQQISSHRCAGTPAQGCRATTPATVTVVRDGTERTLAITPVYDARQGIERTRLGFSFTVEREPVGPLEAAQLSVDGMWRVTTATVSALARIFDPQKRKEISGAVGSFEVTRQSIEFDTTQALNVLAIISLSLAIVNLFPFLPLDGGHIFWALAEKVRGRPIPFWVMERAGLVGFMLVILLFAVGLTNDIDRLRGEGFSVR